MIRRQPTKVSCTHYDLSRQNSFGLPSPPLYAGDQCATNLSLETQNHQGHEAFAGWHWR
jgi:hypothetical protein